MLRRISWYGLILLLVTIGICAVSPIPASAEPDANPIAVNSTADNTIPGDGWCTLREALNNANANADTTAGDCAPGSAVTIDAINMPAGIYQLKTGFDNTNVGGDLDVYSGGGSVRFAGASATNTIIRGPGYIVGTDRIIHAGADEPGPITVEVKRLTLRDGHAPQGGGAIYDNGVTLVVEDSVLEWCTATFGGGMSNNGNGGGVYLATGSDATIRRSTIADNKARSAVVGPAAGGGVYVESGSRLTLEDSYVLRNDVSAIAGPHVNSFGGGIFNVGGGIVKINRSQIVSNTASSVDSPVASGGGIVNFGSMDIWDSLIAENTSNGGAGGMLHSGTSATIGRSTFARNQALQGNAGGLNASTSAYIVNSTFSGNSARYSGGGIEISSPTPVELEYVTVTDNTGDNDQDGVGGVGGVMAYVWAASPSVHNTIIAGNHDNMPADQAYPDVSGPFSSQGHNLVGDGTGSTGFTDGVNGDIVGTRTAPVNARLRPLAYNGGYTPTHLPRWYSRVVDHAEASLQTKDQRTYHRPYGLAPDIGSVELNYLMLPDLLKMPQ